MVKSYNRGLKAYLHFLDGDKESFVLWAAGSIAALNVVSNFSLCFHLSWALYFK